MNSRKLSLFFHPKFTVDFIKRTKTCDCEKIVIKCAQKPDPPMSVAVVGANSKVGKISAMLFKTAKVFKKMNVYDRTCTLGLAYDLNGINKSPAPVRSFGGAKDLEAAITDARIIYICGGIQTSPGLSSQDLFDKNGAWVRQIITYCAEFNPHAFVVITTPPVTYLVPMAIEEFRKGNVDAGKRVFGLTKMLVSRSNSVAGSSMNVLPDKLNSFVVGGCHRKNFIPIISHIDSSRSLTPAKLEALTDQIQDAEDAVLRQKMKDRNSDGCCYSIAYNGVKFTKLLAKALLGQHEIVGCAFVKQNKPMDEYAKYFSCVVEMDKEGVKSCKIPKMSQEEKNRLKAVINEIRLHIFLGSSYITGDDMIVVRIPPKEDKKEEKVVVAKKPAVKEKEECPPKKPPPKSMRIKVVN